MITSCCRSEQIVSFPTHLSGSALRVNSSGMLNDWRSVEDTVTDVPKNTSVTETMCVCVCVCGFSSCKCQNQETAWWIFYSAWLPPSVLHGNADQCKRAEMNSIIRPLLTCSVRERSCRMRGSRLHRFLAGATTVHTHLPSGSEAVLYTCQPSSAPGYSPCTQTALLVKELHFKQIRVCKAAKTHHKIPCCVHFQQSSHCCECTMLIRWNECGLNH